MPKPSLYSLTSRISERRASAWLLLSDTTNFLSRTSIFSQYEAELMEMRRRLAAAATDSATEREVRAELGELRKALRLQGYDLSLGKLELSIQGWRNDAAEIEGFRRLVLFMGERELWFLEGEENHLALHDHLDLALRSRSCDVLQKHYLWYRWNHGQLILSGSATESREDFEALKAWCANPERQLFLLARLRKLQ